MSRKSRKAETTQTAEINRVKKKISDLILEFYHERILAIPVEGQPDPCLFYANDLAEYMNKQIPNTTFDSASRILRDMRQCGQLDYEVVKRSESLYRLERLGAKQLTLGV